MTEIVSVRDEARRRLAMVHGARIGADMTQKALNSVIEHLVTPTSETRYRLLCHMAVLAASNTLEPDPPLDLAADHRWSLPAKQDDEPTVAGQLLRSVVFQGQHYPMPDFSRLTLAVALAGAAIDAGVRANDYRWHGGLVDFGWHAADGSLVPMDAPTVVAFGMAAFNT